MLKMNDDESLKLNARIAPHGNEDSDKENLHTECCMCPPLGIRVVSSTATIRKWHCVRTGAESAFMKTGQSQRDVYVYTAAESRFRNMLWLLVVAAYGLVNSISKWQKQSDDAFIALGLQHIP